MCCITGLKLHSYNSSFQILGTPQDKSPVNLTAININKMLNIACNALYSLALSGTSSLLHLLLLQENSKAITCQTIPSPRALESLKPQVPRRRVVKSRRRVVKLTVKAPATTAADNTSTTSQQPSSRVDLTSLASNVPASTVTLTSSFQRLSRTSSFKSYRRQMTFMETISEQPEMEQHEQSREQHPEADHQLLLKTEKLICSQKERLWESKLCREAPKRCTYA